MAEKETRTKWNNVSNFISPSMGPLHIMTWNHVASIVIYKTVMFVLLGRLFYKDSCYLFSNFSNIIRFSYLQLSSRHFRHTVIQNHVL